MNMHKNKGWPTHIKNTLLCIKDDVNKCSIEAFCFVIIRQPHISETLNQWQVFFLYSVKYGAFVQIKKYVTRMTFSLPLDLDSPGIDL
jgi:hypothetical protein